MTPVVRSAGFMDPEREGKKTPPPPPPPVDCKETRAKSNVEQSEDAKNRTEIVIKELAQRLAKSSRRGRQEKPDVLCASSWSAFACSHVSASVCRTFMTRKARHKSVLG